MNTFLKKTLFLNKTTMFIIIIVFLALAYDIFSFIHARDIERKNSLLSPEIAEMQALAADALQIKQTVALKEKKITRGRPAGIVSTLEQMLKNLGLEAQVIKPLNKKKTDGYTEEGAELEIRKTDLNSIVNFLYNIENSPTPLKIKYASITTMFESPDKFILKLTVSLLGKG